jgi:hypothetical protein
MNSDDDDETRQTNFSSATLSHSINDKKIQIKIGGEETTNDSNTSTNDDTNSILMNINSTTNLLDLDKSGASMSSNSVLTSSTNNTNNGFNANLKNLSSPIHNHHHNQNFLRPSATATTTLNNSSSTSSIDTRIKLGENVDMIPLMNLSNSKLLFKF